MQMQAKLYGFMVTFRRGDDFETSDELQSLISDCRLPYVVKDDDHKYSSITIHIYPNRKFHYVERTSGIVIV